MDQVVLMMGRGFNVTYIVILITICISVSRNHLWFYESLLRWLKKVEKYKYN